MERLNRRLGLVSVTLSGIGVILGAGIYALVGAAAERGGNAAWAGFVIAAVIAGLTALTYGRFARIRPRNSPEFQYASLGLGHRLGFTAGWLMIWSDLISVGAVALGFGGYLGEISPTPAVAGGLLLIGATAALAWWGIGESVALAAVFSVVEVAGLVFIVAVGLPHVGTVNYLEAPQGFGGVWAASALVFFAYLGFDELGNLAEESRTPERTLPLALGIAFLVSSVLYVAVAIAAVSTVGWRVLAASDAPLAEVARVALGSHAHTLLTLVALAATANTVLLLVISGSRSIQAMAEDGAFPRVLARVGGRRTPWAGVCVSAAVAAAFTLIGDLERVAQITNAAILGSFALVNFALLRYLALARSGPRSWRRAMADLALPGAAGATCLALLVYTGAEAIAWAGALALAGLLLGGMHAARSSRPPHA